MGGAATSAGADPTDVPATEQRRKRIRRVLSIVVSLVVVVGIFVYAIPKFADYADVWSSISSLTPIEFASLFAAMVFNLFTYWFANMAALPRLRLWPAAVLTQTTTSVANTLPGGGAIAVGLTYQILKSWGFAGTETARYVGVTGIWNIFAKLALPVLSIAFLVIGGESGAAYIVPAVVGLAFLAAAVALFAAVFWSEALARRVGNGLGRVLSFLLKLVRKAPRADIGDRAVEFRAGTIELVERRWVVLTLTTILSHVALWFVLLLALRHLGVDQSEISTAQTFAVFAFSRLLSAVPVTPGGLGVIDLGYIGGLTAIGGEKAQVVAAVLLFRVLTYGIQIPIGALTYLIWRGNSSWRRAPEDAEEAQPARSSD